MLPALISDIKEMERGTEVFPEIGSHCQLSDCHQLDFLPFTCNACEKVFCVEHRSHKSHDCPKQDVIGSRRVTVCEICSTAIEITGYGGDDVKKILERHEKSEDCDPKKKEKPTCPVRRCKEVLTFSNRAACRNCGIKICLKHRFPADHSCEKVKPAAAVTAASKNKFLVALSARSGKDCANKISGNSSQPSVKAC